MNWTHWEARFEQFLGDETDAPADPAHSLAHVRRVVRQARRLAQAEGADLNVVVPAAWLHDCVQTRKDAPDRSSASAQAGRRAQTFLREAGFPPSPIEAIGHAIAAHSYSAGIPPRTLEAQVVQDADRLDALGAIGIARCFAVGGALGHPLYDPTDPFAHNRLPDDGQFVLDHFYAKLLRLKDQMHTDAGRAEAQRRTDFMRGYLQQLKREIDTAPNDPSCSN